MFLNEKDLQMSEQRQKDMRREADQERLARQSREATYERLAVESRRTGRKTRKSNSLLWARVWLLF